MCPCPGIVDLGELVKVREKTLKKKKNGGTMEYLDLSCSFDIETSSWYEGEEKRSCMYAYGLGIEGKVKIGRTWEEFMDDIAFLVKRFKLSPTRRLLIYVHNLSYEFQFLRKRFEWDNVFALSAREVVYAVTTSGIEFRCSYILSNRSLAQVGDNLTMHKVEKLVGELDYDKVRNSRTPMTERETAYLRNDCLVVMAYIDELRKQEGSLLYIPLTNTGFVRNHCRKMTTARKDGGAYRTLMRHLTLSVPDYLMAKQCFMGGFTHANSMWSRGITENVSSYDLASSYPAVMCSEKFPMSRPYEVKVRDRNGLLALMDRWCVCVDVSFEGIEESFVHDHYISRSKCIECDDAVLDNGRVVKARHVRMILTELDFGIIDRTYRYDSMTIGRCLVFRKEYLPREFVSCVLDFYEMKTRLKNVEGMEAEYEKGKNMLNSCFGMCVTDPCRDVVEYSGNRWNVGLADLAECLKRYDENRNRFLFYWWGLWIPAYGRRNLWTGIESIGEDYIYSDTDSLKILHADRHRDYFEGYNRTIVDKLDRCLDFLVIDRERTRPENRDGKRCQMGTWDSEGTYSKFKTLGAKRYMFVKDGKLNITIAGVGKKAGTEYLMDRYGTADEAIRQFDDGIVFPARYAVRDGKIVTEGFDGDDRVKEGCGKKTHTYIDEETEGMVVDYLGNVAPYHELSSVHLEPTGYDLSLAGAYRSFLDGRKGNWQWKSRNTGLPSR